MDVETPTDSSITGHESHVGQTSSGSYNDNVIAPADSASVASNSVNLPQSPARSTLSVPSSPATAPSMPTANAPAGTPVGHSFLPAGRAQQIDLLDTNDSFGQPYATSRQRSAGGGFTSSDDDQTEPSSSATGVTSENPSGYVRSDVASSATSTFGRLIENTKVRCSLSKY